MPAAWGVWAAFLLCTLEAGLSSPLHFLETHAPVCGVRQNMLGLLYRPGHPWHSRLPAACLPTGDVARHLQNHENTWHGMPSQTPPLNMRDFPKSSCRTQQHGDLLPRDAHHFSARHLLASYLPGGGRGRWRILAWGHCLGGTELGDSPSCNMASSTSSLLTTPPALSKQLISCETGTLLAFSPSPPSHWAF